MNRKPNLDPSSLLAPKDF